jgi:hypothetical protein
MAEVTIGSISETVKNTSLQCRPDDLTGGSFSAAEAKNNFHRELRGAEFNI